MGDVFGQVTGGGAPGGNAGAGAGALAIEVDTDNEQRYPADLVSKLKLDPSALSYVHGSAGLASGLNRRWPPHGGGLLSAP
jgi:hypothetical protein